MVNVSIAGIVFKPAGLATLFNLPVYEYTEERIDLNKIFHPSKIERIASQLKETSDSKQKAKLLESFLLEQFEKNKPQLDFIDRLLILLSKKMV
jgi:hypothetical protein